MTGKTHGGRRSGAGGRRLGAGRKPNVDRPRILEPEHHDDDRGSLRVIDSLPFRARRAFVIDGVSSGAVRGHHAHRRCHQILFCAAGRFDVRVTEISIKKPDLTLSFWSLASGTWLLIPAMHWHVLSRFSADAVCLALMSEPYDESDVIDDWDEFCRLTAGKAKR